MNESLRRRFRGIRQLAALAAAATLVASGAALAQAQEFPATQSGDRSQECDVNWYAESVIDKDLDDYSNNGYIYKVKKNLFAGDPGLYEIQHFFIGGTLYWRIPIGTVYEVNNAKMTINFTDKTWTPIPGSFTADMKNFERFTTDAGYPNSGDVPTAEWNGTDSVTITIGHMPAQSNVMVWLQGTPVNGQAAITAGDTFRLGATFTGDFVLDGGYPTCVTKTTPPTNTTTTPPAPTTTPATKPAKPGLAATGAEATIPMLAGILALFAGAALLARRIHVERG